MASPAPYSRTPYSKEDIARAVATVMGEDNSSAETRQAVASVIANRLATGAWGNTLSDVADSSEFSSSQGDRRAGWNRIVSHIVAALDDKNPRPLTKAEMDAYEDVKGVLDGEIQDPTKGATYFVGNEEAMRAESKGKRSRSDFHENMFDETGSTQIGTQRYGYGSANDRDRARLLAAMSRATDYSAFGPSDTPSEANSAERLGRPVFPSIPFDPFGNVAGLHAAQEPDRQGFFGPGMYKPNFATAQSLGVDQIGYEPSYSQPVVPAPDATSTGFNFSQSFANGLGYNPQFAQPVTPENPPAAQTPGWGSIARGAIRDYASPQFATEDRTTREPESWSSRYAAAANPDYGNAGPGFSAVSTPDFTRDSNGTFQSVAPSTMAGPTGASVAGAAIGAPRAPRAFAVDAPMDFSSAKMNPAAVTTALAAADAEAAHNKALAAAYKPPSPRDDMYGVAPTVEPPTATVAAPKAPQVQKAMPRIAPRPVPMQPPHPPSIPMTQKDLNSYGLGDTPGSQLSAAIGTPSQFMGSGTSPQQFAKTIAAIAAINGNSLAQTYASQLNDPHLGTVAFNALQNEYAKATGQPETKGLLSGFMGDVGQAFSPVFAGVSNIFSSPSQPYGPDTRSTGGGYSYASPALAREYGIDNAGFSPGYGAYNNGGGYGMSESQKNEISRSSGLY